MAKRTRKPPIKPEIRRDWLRRNEEDGESPPQIAEKDKYDVRTVRKQIEQAKQEREGREARTFVLRNAVEKHYDDLRKYAEKLNSEVMGVRDVSSSPDDEFIGVALRQHLPRAPMWAYLLKRQSLAEEENQERLKLDKAIDELVDNDRRLKSLNDEGFNGVIPGVSIVLIKEAEQWLNGNLGHTLRDSVVMEPADEGFVNLKFGFSNMGKMKIEDAEKNAKTIRGVLEKLESRVRDSSEYHDIEKTIFEILRVQAKLREELAIIRLRRIVPGRCKYCPL